MIKCTKCGSSRTKKDGIRRGNQRFYCKDCHNNFQVHLSQLNKNDTDLVEVKNNKAKILVFDIECSLMEVYSFSLYNLNLSPKHIKKDWYMLSWAAKWLYSSETMSMVLSSYEAKNGDDESIVLALWKLLDESDILIGHNIVRFDIPKVISRFAYYNLPLPSPYRVIDTYQVAKRVLGESSNSLDYLCKHFQLNTGKLAHDGLDLWINCMQGDIDTLAEMVEYNKVDTRINETLYIKLLPYIKNHPNINLYGEITERKCPACGSTELVEAGEYVVTNQTKVMSYRCTECSSLARGKTNLLTKDEKKLLTGSV